MEKHLIAVAYGDGIGPEIMEATVSVLKAANAPLEFKEVLVGEKVYLTGEKGGISEAGWQTIKSCKAFLKGPVTTPQGGGFKSLNVTIRTQLGLFANIRPCVAYAPFVSSKFPNMDVIVVRENEEDLYTGVEYQGTKEERHAIKMISYPGCSKIIRFAFDYAKALGRHQVTCFTKDNILKMTDGLFHQVFEEVAKEYPEIISEHYIVDIGAAKLASHPELFDVLVLPNLYGDILSDVAAEIAGSVGLAGSINIGTEGAMFEAIHGSAPKIAGQNKANPSGLLLAAVYMLVYLNEVQLAEIIYNAWAKTLEEGFHTSDIFSYEVSQKQVGTAEFGERVIERLGQKPQFLKPAFFKPFKIKKENFFIEEKVIKEIVGVDIFLEWTESVDFLLNLFKEIKGPFILTGIFNRGAKLWPDGQGLLASTDAIRLRFKKREGEVKLEGKAVIELLQQIEEKGAMFYHVEVLKNFNGKKGFTLAQEEQ